MFSSPKKSTVSGFRQKINGTVAFVPTMGALHAGHISLIEKAKELGDFVAASIFVNPTQFDNEEDLKKYPQPISQDLEKLYHAGCDLCYHPSIDDIYPEGTPRLKEYDLSYLDEILEGAYRDGHYQGVANIVYRLLEVIRPDFLIMGMKDYQQIMIVQRMIDQEGLEVEIVKLPTVREDSGLARSSRNERLTNEEREKASVIFENLMKVSSSEYRAEVDWESAQKNFEDNLRQAGFHTIDYVALADAESLELLENYDETKTMIVLVAAYIGSVRLIDNMIINQK